MYVCQRCKVMIFCDRGGLLLTSSLSDLTWPKKKRNVRLQWGISHAKFQVSITNGSGAIAETRLRGGGNPPGPARDNLCIVGSFCWSFIHLFSLSSILKVNVEGVIPVPVREVVGNPSQCSVSSPCARVNARLPVPVFQSMSDYISHWKSISKMVSWYKPYTIRRTLFVT